MQITKIISLGFIICLGTNSEAKIAKNIVLPKKAPSTISRKISSNEMNCISVKWPFKNQTIQKKDTIVLREMQPSAIRSYYLYEITSEHLRAELARGLYDFLISTEPNSDLRSFYEVTAVSAGLHSGNPAPLNLKEVCELLGKVGTSLPEE